MDSNILSILHALVKILNLRISVFKLSVFHLLCFWKYHIFQLLDQKKKLNLTTILRATKGTESRQVRGGRTCDKWSAAPGLAIPPSVTTAEALAPGSEADAQKHLLLRSCQVLCSLLKLSQRHQGK